MENYKFIKESIEETLEKLKQVRKSKEINAYKTLTNCVGELIRELLFSNNCNENEESLTTIKSNIDEEVKVLTYLMRSVLQTNEFKSYYALLNSYKNLTRASDLVFTRMKSYKKEKTLPQNINSDYTTQYEGGRPIE